MDRALRSDHDPDTLKLLDRAFDAAWRDISGHCCTAADEDRRARLALIILELARRGERDEKSIRNATVSIMAMDSKDSRGPNMRRLQ